MAGADATMTSIEYRRLRQIDHRRGRVLLNYQLPALASPADKFKVGNVLRLAYTLP
jgi:hypothetical protein